MKGLRLELREYLAARRSLGFELRNPARLLRNFVAFAEREGASYVTSDLALRWATQSVHVEPATRAARLGVVRRFASWCQASDPRTEIPPPGLLPHRYRRKRPYIYSDDEIEEIVAAARRLPSPMGLRAQTHSTILGLLAAGGLRVSEAVALDRRDVDLEEGILSIRRTKFGKSRLTPVHPSTKDALAGYARFRDRILRAPFTEAFFVSERGTRVTDGSVRYNFAKVSREIGIRSAAGGRHGTGPRLHDMRHRFAVRILLDWYRAGLDVERELPKLATYLGHVHVNESYWY
ncbi:tyrosine-type recombinase/integrase, partial [bacterium]|nr:tyrosine-type recombinase/integrase [bacterium]